MTKVSEIIRNSIQVYFWHTDPRVVDLLFDEVAKGLQSQFIRGTIFIFVYLFIVFVDPAYEWLDKHEKISHFGHPLELAAVFPFFDQFK